MAATVQIVKLTGSGPTATQIDATNSRASTSDNVYTTQTTNPIPIPAQGSFSISGVTNASPPVVTATGHTYSVGDMVNITGVVGATGVNGTWKITATGTNTFTLGNVSAPGVYSSGGTAKKVNCSFWNVTRLNVTVTPSGTINNLKWYTDGTNSFGTGVAMKVSTATSYIQATGVVGTTGDALSNVTGGYGATLAGVPASSFTYTSASPLSVTGTISNPSTGQFGDYVVYQIEVDSTAGPGTTATETITYQWDET